MTGLTYAAAGVSIDAGDELVRRIKPLAARTALPGVLAGIGGFGALFEMPRDLREPVLVAGTDGVGTKLKLAFALNKHDTIGQDLVAMNVNDVLVQGARPLFFLDYFACGRLDVEVAAQVIGGIARGCEMAGCALIGGETAEMPGMYADGEYDLAGFAVGVVEKTQIIDGRTIAAGDVILGLASSGPHSNGYSLIRKIVERAGARYTDPFGDRSLGEVLLEPTRIYCRAVLAVLPQVAIKGLAHITGGGLLENVPRVLPPHAQAVIERGSWPRPPIFDWIQQAGGVADAEMHRVFNCGIGMVVIVAATDAERALAAFAAQGERAWRIGEIRARPADAPGCVVI
ncbi:MAG: phosphoribosylformylglycinamidine cyclo-ligase [Sutterellaceae bacterium]|nr:phosphoribosylformylglycinamidine cyclo-ligase [Burkholderiaceae bacterium]MDW8429225.1 phosphoribosylformylglycinamidine cyclo-ligase [Sutterellaceae bacterium]